MGASDADGDGLTDRCELEVAQAFAPSLVTSSAQCIVSEGRPAGGYAFVVSPGAVPAQLHLGYAPAYVKDCGWSGKKCWLRWGGGCRGHWGDSEFIGLIVEFDSSLERWKTVSVFLSAHCFGRSDRDCRWYSGEDLNDFDWDQSKFGAPRVWVAEGKNANYPTRARCERGHWWFDTCARNTGESRFPIRGAEQNLGTPWVAASAANETCVNLPTLGWALVPMGTTASSVECFGSPQPFRGWSDTDDAVRPDSDPVGATPYMPYFQLLLRGPPTP